MSTSGEESGASPGLTLTQALALKKKARASNLETVSTSGEESGASPGLTLTRRWR